MLIHGGTISSGRFITFSVVGEYWISSIRSFWSTTLPGVVAIFLPTSNAFMSVMPEGELALATLEILQQVVEALDQVLAAELDGGAQTSGLVITKLHGDIASTNWRV